MTSNGAVRGIATGDMGIGRDGKPKDSYTRGMELLGKYTLFAEGARGILTKQLIAKFALDAKSEPPKFGIGLKEVWQIDPAKHQKGLIQHSFGWPLEHCPPAAARSSITTTTTSSPSASSCISTTTIRICRRSTNSSASRPIRRSAASSRAASGIAYGARAITEGGYQSVPRLSFPGGALIGCAAGFVNVPRIKGVHNAMGTGMLAAEHVAAALGAGRANDELVEYENAWRDSAGRQGPVQGPQRQAAVVEVRHHHRRRRSAASTCGATRCSASRCSAPSRTPSPTARRSIRRRRMRRSPYPKPDGKLSFDKLSSVFLSNTNHEEDQPVHLKVADMNLQKTSEHDVFAGPSNRYCPAGVYEWVEEAAGPRFQINAQNCVHCKTCDVKDPNGNITWVPPEGGGGPNYQAM